MAIIDCFGEGGRGFQVEADVAAVVVRAVDVRDWRRSFVGLW
jgi:hypothetical protein